MKKGIWISFLVLLFVFLTHDRLLGMIAEPRLEKQLTWLFGMPVEIKGLRASLLGKVKAGRVVFWNQQEFAPGPHLEVEGLEFDIDIPALFEKRVKIREIRLDRPYYLIDRIPTPEGPRNNVITWYRHIQSKGKSPLPASGTPSRKWRVAIDKIRLRDGAFTFHDRSGKDAEKKFVFQKLDGALGNFVWPTPDPSLLSQTVKVSGTFGEFYPAPFEIEGRANFATSKVSFNLEGLIREGLLAEHKRLWEGSSIQILDGTFELTSRTICLRNELQSYNDLILKSPRVAPGPSATDKVWGLPKTATMAFLQNQKTIHLKVAVHGNISDPQFEFPQAFRTAFQQALARRAKAGISLIADGSLKLASQTRTVVQKTPGTLAESFGKITSIVKSARNGTETTAEPVKGASR